MSKQYLLPCRCGQQYTVEPPQAGETIACSCGASLQVPTMLEMARLEPAPSAPAAAPAAAAWGWRQGVLLVCIVLIVAGSGIIAAAYHWMRPTPPADLIDPEQIRETAKRLNPVQTWQTWEGMKQSLGRTDTKYAADLVVYHGLLVIGGIVVLLGAGSIVGVVMSDRSPRANL